MFIKEFTSSSFFFGKREGRRPSNNYSTSFPLLSKRRFSSILEGKFDYNESFNAFVNATNQKKDSASIIGAFARKLSEKQVFGVMQKPINVADIGCADSSTCLRYLKYMSHHSGFHYFGVDNNQKFLDEAKKKLSNNALIKKHTLINGDALSGKLRAREEFASVPFDFIFASHIAYYLKNQSACRLFLEDIIKLLSEQCGIAIFLHEDSTYYFRSTYNKDRFNTTTPILLEESARDLPANFNQFKSISFTSKLHFSPLRKELWEAAKYPHLYKNFAEEPEFIDTLKKLSFIVQRGLIELANEGSLATYIDEIRDAISDNYYCLDLETRMQTLVAPQCKLRHKIARALKETGEEIPSLLAKEMNEDNQYFYSSLRSMI